MQLRTRFFILLIDVQTYSTMFDTIVEGDAVDTKVTLIELQSVKKDETFAINEHIPSNPLSHFTPHFPSSCDSINCKTQLSNSLLDISDTTTGFVNENESKVDEIMMLDCKSVGNEDGHGFNDPSHPVTESEQDVKSGMKSSSTKNDKNETKCKKWNSSPKENSCVKESKKKKKSNAQPAKLTDCSKTEEVTTGRKLKCEYPRLCSGCGHAYKTKQSFWNHKQRCVMLPQNNMRSVPVDENGVPGENGTSLGFVRRKEYICAHCERHYRKKYNLQEHLKNTCRGKPCSKGRLRCWEEGCMQAFYKYVDLVQHVTLQHGQDLQIQKLSFPNLSAFNNWKTEESNSKFMYARKITGSKRFSNTKYHYFVCQFNHRNEKKNNNRKTNRRKSMNLVVPNYNCPSRIMVKECENQIQVTYISSHNHELNLANVKYQPLEKETRTYIKTLLQLGVSPKRIKDHLQEGVGNPEIDSFLATKQHFLTLNRIKRMESKLKAKNRARQIKEDKTDDFVSDQGVEGVPLVPSANDDVSDPAQVSKQLPKKDSDDVIRSIENNLKKLKGYVHKNTIKEKLSDRISKMIQELCDECEHMESTDGSVTQRKSRTPSTPRRRKIVPAQAMSANDPLVTSVTSSMAATVVPTSSTAALTTLQLHPVAIEAHQPSTHVQHQSHSILLQHQQPIQSHIILQQPITIVDPSRIMTNVITNVVRNEKSFSTPIHDNMDLLKPICQPYNVNLLCLKSIDPYIPECEQILLSRVDECFSAGHVYDAVMNSFMDLICQPLSNVIAANTGVTEFVQLNQKVPDVWHCYNWNEIDTLFIPCNPSKEQWFLLVLLVKNSELQIFDPTVLYETMQNIYKKYESSIQCWYNVLHNFLGISQCNVTFPLHTKNENPMNSGVLVCWYVYQFINKRNLNDNMDTDIFRKYIYNTILSTSSPVLVDVQDVR